MRKLSKFYKVERERGVVLSTVMHLFFLFTILVGIPDLLLAPPPEPVTITVELLPVTGITNIKPMTSDKPKPDPKPEEKPKPPTKQEDKPAPAPKASEAPAPKEPEPAPKEDAVPLPDSEKKKDEKKKEEKPDEKKKDKKPDEPKDEKKTDKKKSKNDDFAALLDTLAEEKEEKKDDAEKKKEDEKKESEDKEDKASKNTSKTYDESLPMSLSEKDAIMSQFAKYWNVPAGAKDAYELVVLIDIEVRQDGEILKVELANESKARYSQDPFFRAAADAAIRAVKMANPLKNLPPEKYQTWKEMELRFDPREMLY